MKISLIATVCALSSEKKLNELQSFYLSSKESTGTTAVSPNSKSYSQTENHKKRTIVCFTCNAPSFTECALAGSSKICSKNQVCMIELRKRNQKVFQVHMGCKQKNACLVQQSQNFMHKNWRLNQCRPNAVSGPSVCRACCAEDQCLGYSEETFSFNQSTPKSKWRKAIL